MKKILSTVAALGLVAGMATAASATEFKISGYYFVEGAYLSSGDGAGITVAKDAQGEAYSNDSFWYHEFKIKPTMKVNDKIDMKAVIKVVANKFGQDTSSASDVAIPKAYMEYKSDIGKFRIGRTPASSWEGDFISHDGWANRIMYWPNFLPENFSACIFTQKATEADAEDATASSDYDVYSVGGTYKVKDLKVSLAIDHHVDDDTAGTTTVKNVIKAYYNQNIDNIYAEMELAKVLGTTESSAVGVEDVDISSLAIMADVGMKMDKLDVGVLAFMATGEDDGTDVTAAMSSTTGLGDQFQPYVVLTGRPTGMLTTDAETVDADMRNAGVISLGVHADFAASDKLNLHTALAFAKAENAPTDVDDTYGWEIDLGATYALMDNLSYTACIGYLAAGDFFKGVNGVEETEDVYVAAHRLTMTF